MQKTPTNRSRQKPQLWDCDGWVRYWSCIHKNHNHRTMGEAERCIKKNRPTAITKSE